MAEKDISEKVLLSHPDVFADCVNTLAYGGRARLKAEDMRLAPTESFLRGSKRMHNQFCDLSFYLVEQGRTVLQYILGNETRLGRYQVLRKACYLGGAYRAQIASGTVYPVVGMVLDWTRKSTGIPLNLHGLLEKNGAAREDLELVDEVRLPVWHMKKLPKEVRARFSSDMGFVVDYLNEGNFDGRKHQRICHPEALCEMMEALTGDYRFTDMVGELRKRQERKEEVIMCEYIDMLEARGKEIGENHLASLLSKLYALGRDEDAKLAVNDRQARRRFYEELCIG